MKRVHIGTRSNLEERAEEAGFTFVTMYGEPYWEEESAYAFTLRQIEEDLEESSTELHEMCRQAVDRIISSEHLMERLGVPREHWDLVANSWSDGDPEFYGRFDLVYDGDGPAQLLEYNADTPTSVFESASFQWGWLEDCIASGRLPATADQFNRVFEAMVERFRETLDPGTDVHFASAEGNVEDYATVEAIAYAARDAGMGAHYVPIDKIGLTDAGQFADDESRVIGTLFALYPWEDMLRDRFADAIAGSRCRMIEPAWKALVSNKGILAVLWDMFEDHPNLLPAFFEEDFMAGAPAVTRSSEALDRGIVRKPLFSREGASLTIESEGRILERAEDRTYDEYPMVVQAYRELPLFDGFRPVLGTWMVGRACVGLGIREDQSRITQNLSRFKPHYIES
jgi:glutathionylspermidine synthase